MSICLEAVEVSKTFRHGAQFTKALEGVSFSCEAGKTVGILGPNGAGKTTLLRIFAGLLLPDRGRAWIRHGANAYPPAEAKKYVGFTFSRERSFYGRLNAFQNLEFFAALYGLPGWQAREKSRLLLAQLGLSAVSKNPCQTYSSGQFQRLCLARALLHDPPVILVDEMSRSLDFTSSQEIQQLFKQHTRKKTVLLATNNLEEAQNLCDDLILLNQGRMIAHGPLEEILQKTGLPDLKDIFRSFQSLAAS